MEYNESVLLKQFIRSVSRLTNHRLNITFIYIYIYVYIYRQVSNIRRTLAGNWIVDHSDVFGASPVGAAPTTSAFST